MTHSHLTDAEVIALVGGVVIWWGRTEHLMFTDLLELRQEPAIQGKAKFAQVPISTNPLIRQWSAAALLMETETAAQREVELVRDELYRCAEDRNIIVHGFWDYPEPEPKSEHKITVMKPTRDNASIEFRQYQIDRETLQRTHNSAVSLYHRILPFTLNRRLRRRDTP